MTFSEAQGWRSWSMTGYMSRRQACNEAVKAGRKLRGLLMKLDMVVGISHHTAHMKLTFFVYFNNKKDKMTNKKRCHVKRLVVLMI